MRKKTDQKISDSGHFHAVSDATETGYLKHQSPEFLDERINFDINNVADYNTQL